MAKQTAKKTANPAEPSVKRGRAGYKIDSSSVYPGVTTILSRSRTSMLSYYGGEIVANKAIAEADEFSRRMDEEPDTVFGWLRQGVTDESRRVLKAGSEAHAAIERQDRTNGYADAAYSFLDDMGWKLLATEIPGACKAHGYAGTMDAVAETSDGALVVIDWKTKNPAQNPAKAESWDLYPDQAHQVAAYAAFDYVPTVDGWREPEGGYVVSLREDGRYKAGAVAQDRAFATFLSRMHYYNATEAEADTGGAFGAEMSGGGPNATPSDADNAVRRAAFSPLPPSLSGAVQCQFTLTDSVGKAIRRCRNKITDRSQTFCHVHG